MSNEGIGLVFISCAYDFGDFSAIFDLNFHQTGRIDG